MPSEDPYDDPALAEFGLQRERLPRHIAIIMDGNGRWAQQRSLPRIEGHRRGVGSVRRTVRECRRLGIEQLTLYCLSSENWKRPPKELNLLMKLLKQFVVEERRELMRQEIRLSMIGRREGLSEAALRELDRTAELTADNTALHLCLAINYGSRSEIVDAVRAMMREGLSGELDPETVDEQTVDEHLYTAGMPDPDLMLRTAGERRLSNYLLWQSSYAELWVTQKCWPEFDRDLLHEALRDYGQRLRKYGAVPT